MSIPTGKGSAEQWKDMFIFLSERLKRLGGWDLVRMNFIDHYLLRLNSYYRREVNTMLLNFTLSVGVNFMPSYHTRLLPHGDYLREEKERDFNAQHHQHRKSRVLTMKKSLEGPQHTHEHLHEQHAYEHIQSHGNHSYSHLTHAQTIYDRVSALPQGRCVASHIRRGDRVPRDGQGHEVNGTDYCEHHPNDVDKGCIYPWTIPFFAVDLWQTLRAAETLIDVHHSHSHDEAHYLFVNTDERPWLIERVAEYEATAIEDRRTKYGVYGHWKVIYFPLDPDDALTENYAAKGGTSWQTRGGHKSGIYFFAALEMMRQCEGFIGNFQSALATSFYRFMCVRHRDLRNVCPPKHDFSLGQYI
jgi:hypothetical protein